MTSPSHSGPIIKMKLVDMHIVLRRRGEGWSADIAEWPGSPCVGRGATEIDALAALAFYTMFNPIEEFKTTADSCVRIWINDRLWKDA